MKDFERPIGFMDSGLGGLSVLKEALRLLPEENYIYLGDSKHAPYGTKDIATIRELTLHNVGVLMEQGVKAVVVACNTATSAAINEVRKQYPSMPVIGVEPALKPAVETFPGGRILVMATPATLQEEKFLHLMNLHQDEASIVPVSCPGLPEFVERGETTGERLHNFLLERLKPYMSRPVDAIVLGCTHYPFVKGAIQRVVGEQVQLFDGSLGTVHELERQLDEHGLRNQSKQPGTLQIQNTSKDAFYIRRSYAMLEISDKPLEN